MPIAATFNPGVHRLTGVAAQDEPGQTLTVAASWEPLDLDPHSAYDPGSGLALPGPYEGLIRLKPGSSNRFQPLLAESWEASTDRRVWTFRLREGVRFHDGSLCNAEAVRRSYERLLALALPPANVIRRFIESVDQIRIVDDLTVEFDLGRPQHLFERALAAPFGSAIINVAAAQRHESTGDWGHAWAQTNADGLGTGPYRVTSVVPLEGVTMEQFDDYWRGWDGNHFDQVVIRVVPEAETRRELIEQGDADIIELVSLDAVEELEANSALFVHRQTNLAVRYLAFAIAGHLASPEARQALCWAFPYDDVLQGVFLGYARPALGAVAERCYGFSRSPAFSTDLERASSLLQQAGIEPGTRLTTPISPGNPLLRAIAELFQINLAKIGIELEIEMMDYATYVGMVYGELPAGERPNLMPAFWQPDYDDAWTHLSPLVSCDSWASGNVGHYCNDQVEQFLMTARNADNETAYLDALAEAQHIVGYEDPAAIYFAQPEWITVLRGDVEGFALHPVAGEIFDYYALHRAT